MIAPCVTFCPQLANHPPLSLSPKLLHLLTNFSNLCPFRGSAFSRLSPLPAPFSCVLFFNRAAARMLISGVPCLHTLAWLLIMKTAKCHPHKWMFKRCCQTRPTFFPKFFHVTLRSCRLPAVALPRHRRCTFARCTRRWQWWWCRRPRLLSAGRWRRMPPHLCVISRY